MARANILFADNDPDFLKTRTDFLKQEGYCVILATSPAEAQRLLERGGIDVAILDIRLRDDDDEKDTSGLTLAGEVARSIPKIMLTNFATVDAVRGALRVQRDGLPAAANFVDKKEGPEKLLNVIRQTLESGKKQTNRC
jgi:DNA-binding NtrC family response regulator